MQVRLLHATPLWIAKQAIRTCWDSHDKSDTYVENGVATDIEGNLGCGEKDRELIHRVGNKFKHASTLEHVSFNFEIKGISRALLHEIARTRIASISVKSTRYTLKELKEEESFMTIEHESEFMRVGIDIDRGRASQYIVMTGNDLVDNASILALEGLRGSLNHGISNDIAKYCLPEAYKTELTWTLNLRALQHLIYLRSDKSALWEYRKLIQEMIKVIPEEYQYLIEEFNKG